jgi:hypothetical protein
MKSFRNFAVLLLLGALSTPAQAGLVDTIVNGVENTYQDLSRSRLDLTVVGNGTQGLAVGDTVIGFLEIDKQTTPGATKQPGTATLYVAFSLQIAGFQSSQFGAVTSSNAQTIITFQPTPAANPLSLQSITGVKVPTGTEAVVYDVPNGTPGLTDLLTTNPPKTGAASTMENYLQHINSNYNLELALGATGAISSTNGQSPNNDYLFLQLGQVAGVQLTGATATPNQINALPNSIGFGSLFGGLSVLENNTNFDFAQNVIGQDLKLHQFTLQQASENGGNDLANFKNWGPQNLNQQEGTSDNASVSFTPSAVVPEPSSMILLSIGGLGLLGGCYLRRRKTAA